MVNISIVGTGSALPKRCVTNQELAELVDTSDEWIVERTGIKTRYVSDDTPLSTLASEAAMKAVSASELIAEDIDLIIVGTATPDKKFPSTACEVQSIIGATHAVCMDISAACSGFIYACQVAESMLRVGKYKTALVIGADVLTKYVDWKDRGTCVLFGDGAGAVVLSAGDSQMKESSDILASKLGSDGMKGSCLTCNSQGVDTFVHMEGQEVFKFAVRTVPKSITEVLDMAGVDKKDITHYILHQANKRIIDAVAKKLDEDIEKFPINMDRIGNTDAASIPILIDELYRNGKIKKEDLIVLSGFGGGLTWGSMLIRM